MSPILFLAVGSFLLVVLSLFLRDGRGSQVRIRGLSQAHEVLNVLQSELLPDWFVDRLFSKEDWEFAQGQGSPRIAFLFDRERRTVALSWLRQTQEHVTRLMDFHLRMSRQRPDLRPLAEVKVTLEYVRFQLLCKFLGGLIRIFGPVRFRSMVGHTVGIATRLGAVSEKVLTHLDDAIPVNTE